MAKVFVKYWEKVFSDLIRNLEAYRTRQEVESLHQVRVELKKIKVLFSLKKYLRNVTKYFL